MNEFWKDIPGYEGLYRCSNLGRVKSLGRPFPSEKKERILAGSDNGRGYLVTSLFKNKKLKTMRVHRIIALTFIPNPEKLKEVNHLDGDKKNNSVDNLEWSTRSDNVKHAWDNGLARKRKKKLSEKEIFEIRTLCERRIKKKPNYNQIGKLYNVTGGTVRNVFKKLN